MSAANYVQVALPVPMRQTFTYQVPDKLTSPKLVAGERVVVPFGQRKLVGIVTSCHQQTEVAADKIKAVISRLPSEFNFSTNELTFLQACAAYYHHPMGDVFQHALPVLLRAIEPPNIAPVTLWFHADDIEQTERDKLAKKAGKQFSLYQLIARHQGIGWPEIRTMGYSKSQLNALAGKGWINEQEQAPEPFKWQDDSEIAENKLQLSVEQAVVVSACEQQHHFGCHLLHGITGSGKTEVYLQLMTAILSQDKQVLVIVPEIGLTPQLLTRFEQRFNLPIYLHHSGLNDNERLQTWLAARNGSAAIIIGTRSAVFTPLPQPGLIIVDEEHDSSLKQQEGFRYHARDLAILRARQLNIPVLLGSATPSLETLQNAFSGKYHYHQLRKRAGNSVQATTEIVDVSNQRINAGIAESIHDAISRTLARDEQVLIFLNRRGYAPALSCQECHHVIHCQRCDRPYTYHRQQNALICHHCGSQKPVVKQCGHCGSVRIKPLGQGTEQLEHYLSEKYADYTTVRIDRDSTRRKGQLTQLLQQVNDKKYHLLIGTQMLAKGHHFPEVTLVVVLDIDGALFSYDFRAAEYMAQLLTQVAGRAGRASKPGRVLIQSQYPQHPLLQDLVHNGFLHFAQQALIERQQAMMPPFSFQALFRAEANNAELPRAFLHQLIATPIADCYLAGPLPAAMEKKAGKYRFHLTIQAKQRRQLHQGIEELLYRIATNPLTNKVRWSVDVDPYDLTW